MSRETELEAIWKELREIKEIIVTANDTALAALQAGFTQLQTDVDALIAAISADSSDDISAGVNAVTADMATLDTAVKAATPAEALSVPAQAIDAAAGAAVNSQLTASGGTPPYTFTAATLSSGLALSDTGVVTGSVAAAGTFTDTVTVTDSTGATASGTLTTAIS